jgi:3-oxoadipate enol-lactonase
VSAAVEVHHEAAGPAGAPVLVMSHSLGASLAMWQPQVDALADRFRVVCYDHRGHGRSPVPPGPYEIADLGADLIALLDRLGVARAHVCGLSIGGMVGLWAAARHPDRIDRLVVLCTSALLGPPDGWRDRAALVLARGTEAVADGHLARWLTPGFVAEHPELWAELRAMLVATDPEGYAASCGAIERMDLRADLAAIRAPVLAVAGADDPATPPEHLVRIAESIPGGRVEVVAGAAHLASLEKADEVTALIAGHLGGA